MPIVDDPFVFGQIAACNAISDIYAMGARPILALAILGFPVKKIDATVAHEIMRGGSDICQKAGIPLAGGHSIDDTEPKFGLSVSGTVHPKQLWSNAGAKPGDKLVLTKPIGVGIMGYSIKKGALSPAGYRQFVRSTTTLNKGAASAGRRAGISAATDITGFGLLGHALELAKAADVGVTIYRSRVPVYEEAISLLSKGIRPGATARNLQFIADSTAYDPSLSEQDLQLLCDPQTSGGLLLSVPEKNLEALLDTCREEGTLCAAVIGTVAEGPAALRVLCEPDE